MSAEATISGIERHHVKALIDLLDEQAEAFFSDAVSGDHRWRVYFVDADVLAPFINGRTKEPLSDWSSLLSLGDVGQKSRHQASAASAALANVTGQAIVRYLFGAFRKTAEIQRRRLFVTPEHEREFKSIILALLHRQARVDAGWLDQLRECYLDLGKRGDHPEGGRDSASEIVRLLELHADNGAEDRAYSLLRDSIAPFSSHLLTPPGDQAKPFLFATTDPDFQALNAASRDLAWRAFSSSMTDRVPGIEDLLAIKRVVFDAHKVTDIAPRSFTHIRAKVMDWLASGHAPPALRERRDLDLRIKVAAREAADLASIAQIDALGRWLNQVRTPPTNQSWEPVLVTGSSMLANVLKYWQKQGDAPVVRLMHPLALLRRVDLWDPAGTRRLRDVDYLDQPHEFALSLIFRSSGGAASKATENVDAFTNSLREQLDVVVAREAEIGDRGLGRLRRMLETDQMFDRKEYQEAVRDLVTQRFVQTYRHLTELFPGVTRQLPASSLPTLDLPHSKSAMRFMASVRTSILTRRAPDLRSEDLQKSIDEDPTGYSALLSSAIGYMARGSAWLSAAQTMSATAVLLAKGRAAARYPEGNEALYLDAFLQRMTLRLDDDIEKFRRTHGEIMSEAYKTLSQWADQEGDIAQERIGIDHTAPNRSTWIHYRYRLEDCAREVFIVLHCVLRRETSGLHWSQISSAAEDSLVLHREGVSLIGNKKSWPALQEPSIWFCGIQSGISLLQLWLCWREISRLDNDEMDSSISLRAYEAELEPIVAGWYEHRQELGKLLPLLAAIFARETGHARIWLKARVANRDFEVSFAAIDEERFAWLQRHWLRSRILSPKSTAKE